MNDTLQRSLAPQVWKLFHDTAALLVAHGNSRGINAVWAMQKSPELREAIKNSTNTTIEFGEFVLRAAEEEGLYVEEGRLLAAIVAELKRASAAEHGK
jgi:hypothetical protein